MSEGRKSPVGNVSRQRPYTVTVLHEGYLQQSPQDAIRAILASPGGRAELKALLREILAEEE